MRKKDESVSLPRIVRLFSPYRHDELLAASGRYAALVYAPEPVDAG